MVLPVINVQDAERDRRMAICEQCPELIDSKLGTRCRKCGCVMKYKSRLKFGKCPLKKW